MITLEAISRLSSHSSYRMHPMSHRGQAITNLKLTFQSKFHFPTQERSLPAPVKSRRDPAVAVVPHHLRDGQPLTLPTAPATVCSTVLVSTE